MNTARFVLGAGVFIAGMLLLITMTPGTDITTELVAGNALMVAGILIAVGPLLDLLGAE